MARFTIQIPLMCAEQQSNIITFSLPVFLLRGA
jgi:hypothetical protein